MSKNVTSPIREPTSDLEKEHAVRVGSYSFHMLTRFYANMRNRFRVKCLCQTNCNPILIRFLLHKVLNLMKSGRNVVEQIWLVLTDLFKQYPGSIVFS